MQKVNFQRIEIMMKIACICVKIDRVGYLDTGHQEKMGLFSLDIKISLPMFVIISNLENGFSRQERKVSISF